MQQRFKNRFNNLTQSILSLKKTRPGKIVVICTSNEKMLGNFLTQSEDNSSLIEDICFYTSELKILEVLKGQKIYHPEEVLKPEHIKFIDETAVSIAKNIFASNQIDYSSYQNVDYSFFSEYLLVPHFIHLLKSIIALKIVLEKEQPTSVVLVGFGELRGIAREILRQSSFKYMVIRGRFLQRYFMFMRNIWEQRKTKWVFKPFRTFFLTPFFDLYLFLRGYSFKVWKKVYNRPQTTQTRYRLMLAAERFMLPVYDFLKKNQDWSFVFIGDSLPGRRLFLGKGKDNCFLEEYVTLSIVWRTWLSILHFWRQWRMLKSDKAHLETFVFQGINYWQLIARHLKGHMLITFPRLYLHREMALQALKSFPNGLLCMSEDVTPYSRAILSAAKSRGISSLHVQHGILGERNVHSKVHTDVVAIWGKGSRQWFNEFKNEEKQMEITGNPRFDLLYEKIKKGFSPLRVYETLKIPGDRKIITVCTSAIYEFSASRTQLENNQMIEATMNYANEHPEFHIVVKLHPGETLDNYQIIHSKFKSRLNLSFVREIDLYELLNASTVLISWYSTTVLEAIILGRPVIICDFFGDKPIVPYVTKGVALGAFNTQGLYKALDQVINNKDTRARLIGNGQDFIRDFAYSVDGKATERVGQLIKNMAESPRGIS